MTLLKNIEKPTSNVVNKKGIVLLKLNNQRKLNQKTKRVCKGPGSSKGKFNGRGQNGQKAKRKVRNAVNSASIRQLPKVYRKGEDKSIHIFSRNTSFKFPANPNTCSFDSLKEEFKLPNYIKTIKIIGLGKNNNKKFFSTENKNKKNQ